MDKTAKEKEREWEIEDAVRTLTKAEEIKKDKKLMAEASSKMIEQVSSIEEVMEVMPEPKGKSNPYKIKGKAIYHLKGGRWIKKQQCSSVENAKAALRLLMGVEHGWKPTGAPAKK